MADADKDDDYRISRSPAGLTAQKLYYTENERTDVFLTTPFPRAPTLLKKERTFPRQKLRGLKGIVLNIKGGPSQE